MTDIATIIIAIIVAFIGFLQYLNNKEQKIISEEKLKLELFDKRFKVFESTRDLFQQILQLGKVDRQEARKFRQLTMDAIFLFDVEIHDYLEKEVHIKALRLNNIVKEYDPLPVSTKKTKLHKERVEIVDWFRGEYFELQYLFSPYLKFREWEGYKSWLSILLSNMTTNFTNLFK
ncbi:MAG: hypothetical protein HOG49_05845 [Candidatus Scalindua sp.]|jgi:hypothetical protein|nr:hypothetical protein [Candidatus Scalindua sp.]